MPVKSNPVIVGGAINWSFLKPHISRALDSAQRIASSAVDKGADFGAKWVASSSAVPDWAKTPAQLGIQALRGVSQAGLPKLREFIRQKTGYGVRKRRGRLDKQLLKYL
jgi:hypothetical protein